MSRQHRRSKPTVKRQLRTGPVAQKLLSQAMALGASVEAIDIWFSAFQAEPNNEALALRVALALSDLGRQDRAIDLLQAFIQANGVSKDILMICGKVAMEIEAFEAAEKLFQQVVGLDPNDEASYLHLVTAQGKCGKYDQAVDVLQSVLPAFPQNAKLWSKLGEILDCRDGHIGKSATFYEEAIRLDPQDYAILTAYAHTLGDTPEALALYEQALAIKPDWPDANMGLALWKLAQGNLKEGWKHYEYRFDARLTAHQSVMYDVKAKRWSGQSVQGKAVLVMAEQGIGDEVFFAAAFQRLIDEGARLFIGCEPRLVSVFQRSFPTAFVGSFRDQISNGRRYRSFPAIQEYLIKEKVALDYCVPFGSICAQYWNNKDQIPVMEGGYLKADPELVSKFADKVANTNSSALKVGISWQSGKLENGRGHYYPGLEAMMPILKMPGVEFFVLQYSSEAAVLDAFEAEHDIRLHRFEGVDLKQDIEANLAIMQNLDFVVGPPIATQTLAMALGKKVIVMCDGWPWITFGNTDGGFPVFPNAIGFKKLTDYWSSVIDPVRHLLRLEVERHEREGAHSGRQDIVSVPSYWLREFKQSLKMAVLQDPLFNQANTQLERFLGSVRRPLIGVAWDVVFNVCDGEPNAQVIRVLAQIMRKCEASFFCLHSDVDKNSLPPELREVGVETHFFDDFGCRHEFGRLTSLLPKLDMVIAPCSLIALYSMMMGTKTILLDDGKSWDFYQEDLLVDVGAKDCVRLSISPDFLDTALLAFDDEIDQLAKTQ